MEGPLVSDTTEILSGAPAASEDAPAGISAPPAAAGGSSQAPKSRSRGGSGAGLSSLLMPELQRIAHTLGIPGAGRMRKSQLVEAIEARQGGSAASKGSGQRAASAGAGATRPAKQDEMESGTHGIGDAAPSGIGDAARGGIGDAAAQQLSFYEESAPRAAARTEAQASTVPGWHWPGRRPGRLGPGHQAAGRRRG